MRFMIRYIDEQTKLTDAITLDALRIGKAHFFLRVTCYPLAPAVRPRDQANGAGQGRAGVGRVHRELQMSEELVDDRHLGDGRDDPQRPPMAVSTGCDLVCW